MASNGQKILSSVAFDFAKEQRLLVRLLQIKGAPKPFRVHVTHRDGGKCISSGYTCLEEDEGKARELLAWTMDEAKKKGWEVASTRAGGRLRMLDGVPAPKRGVGRPPQHQRHAAARA